MNKTKYKLEEIHESEEGIFEIPEGAVPLRLASYVFREKIIRWMQILVPVNKRKGTG